MKRVNITVGGWEKEMNPLIFGHFVEFMRDCIDGGMWAQLLKNRGFDRKKDIPAGVVDANPGVAEGWVRTGDRNTFEISLDSSESLARDGYSQRINCYNAYGGYVGVAQGNLCLYEEEYKGYIWMKACGSTEIIIRIKINEEVIFAKEFCPDGEWRKYEFQFCSAKKTEDAVFEIMLPGEGEVWLDGASLMPAECVDGIWREVYEQIEELGPSVIRYPGGCFADCYHFEDGIGDIDTRPYRKNLHWGGYTDNSFGTDEFIRFCRDVGCSPMICVNFGSGTPEEAANWVEYCNGSVDTVYGKMRAENGHPKPYNIRYWDIGNEIFGEWEIGHSSAGEYSERYLKFCRAMKEKDPSIICMACGGDGDNRSQEWNRTVRNKAGNNIEALCLHMYALKSMEGKRHGNRAIYYAVAGAVKKYEEILQESSSIMNEGAAEHPVQIAVTEYNLGTIVDSGREQTLEAALFNAGMLNMFLRNCDRLLMCNYSDLVNGWPGGCIVSRNGKAFGTGSYYVLQLYSRSRLRKVLEVSDDSPVYSTSEMIGNIEPLCDVPLVDTTAGRDEDGCLVVFAVNRSLDEEVCLKVSEMEGTAEITEIWSANTWDMNSADDMRIVPDVRIERETRGGIIIKPHSVSRIRFTGERNGE